MKDNDIITRILGGIAGAIGVLVFIAFELFIYGAGICLAVWFFLKVISWF